MADGDTQELKLHIVTDVDSKGLQDVSAGTKKLTADTSALGDSTKTSMSTLPPLQQELKKSGAAAEEAGLSHRELRKVFDELGNVTVPGLGAAFGELATGPVGIGLMLVGVYEALKDKLEADAKAAEDLADALATPDTGGVQALQTAWEGAIKAAAAYNVAMANAGKDNDPVATELKRIKEINDARMEAYKKELEVLEQMEEARARIDAGPDKEKAETEVAAIKARYDQQSAAADDAKKKADGSAGLIQEQQRREGQAAALDKAAKDARAKAEAADAEYGSKEKELDKATGILNGTGTDEQTGKTIQKAQNDAEAARNEALENMNNFNIPLDQRQEALKVAQAEVDRIKEIIDLYRKLYAQLSAGEQDEANKKKAADDASAAADDASKTNQKRLRELPGEIDQAQAVETEAQRATQATADIAAATRAMVANSNAELSQNVAEAQRAYAQSLQVIQKLAKDATDAAKSHSATMPIISAALKEMEYSINVLQRQMRSMSHNTQ